MRLAGIMFWAPDLDDFTGKICQEGKYPLMNTAVSLFRDHNLPVIPYAPVTNPIPTATIPTVVPTLPTVPPTVPTRSPFSPVTGPSTSKKRVVCYYTK